MDLGTCNRSRNFITSEKERECENKHTQHYSHAAKKQRLNGGCKQIEKKTKVCGDGWILDLPLHLIYDILSRLPTNSVFSCKCVCKTFLNIIVDPYFGKITRCIDHRIIITDPVTLKFYLVHMFDCGRATSSSSASSSASENDQNYWQALTMPNSLSQSKGLISLVGSCNGLLCIRFILSSSYVYYVCNPLLGEFTVLPNSNRNDCRFVGFGFCLKTKQYKVIRLLNCLSCEILTLGTNCWRRIAAPLHPRNWKTFDTSFNGNLHWITNSMVISNTICSFNLETEHFEYISPPTHLHPNFMSASEIGVGVLGGLFSLYYIADLFQYEVYVMKEYGVKESWNKEISIDLRPSFSRSEILKLVGYLNNGDVLLSYYGSGSLYYYNSRTRTTKVIMEEGSSWDAVDHVPSFVSLNDVVGLENVEVIQPKRLRSFWSKEGTKLFEIKRTARAEVVAGVVPEMMLEGRAGLSAVGQGEGGEGVVEQPIVLPLRKVRWDMRWDVQEKCRLALMVSEFRARFPKRKIDWLFMAKKMNGRGPGSLRSAWNKYNREARGLAVNATAGERAVVAADLADAAAEEATALREE